MKIAFFVSSAINLDDSPEDISYKKRSVYTAEERLMQTQFTLSNINFACPGADIFLMDVSKNAEEYKARLQYVPNLDFSCLETIDPESANLARTTNSKGLAETINTCKFLTTYYGKLRDYDFIIKISGRYFFNNFDTTLFVEENKNSTFFRQVPMPFWNSDWGIPELFKKDDYLAWAFTATYAIGKYKLDNYFSACMDMLDYYKLNTTLAEILPYESAFYHFVIQKQNFLPINWIINGWGSHGGGFSQW